MPGSSSSHISRGMVKIISVAANVVATSDANWCFVAMSTRLATILTTTSELTTGCID